MKTYLFVAEDGEAAQALVRDSAKRGIEVVSYIGDNDIEGSRLRQIYDVTARPAVLVTQEDGSYVRLWQGVIPAAGDVAYAVQGRM